MVCMEAMESRGFFFVIDMSFFCYHWCTQRSKGHALGKMGMCGDR